MPEPWQLRITGTGRNSVGDTLTRLASDFFHTLGYERFRLNIHKSGREVDLMGAHRHEARIVVAECKAHAEKIGGADINKFFGVLHAERQRNHNSETVGYFVSTSGFTETAIEQESEFDPPRILLIDGPGIVRALVEAKFVVDATKATEVAGRYVQLHRPKLMLSGRMELVGSSIGWVWSIGFGDGSTETAVCLVHADGTIVSKELNRIAKEINPLPAILREGLFNHQAEVYFKRQYRDYISSEYGHITLEGMPADQQVGSRSFRLEDLYVPLTLTDLALQSAKLENADIADRALGADDPEEDVGSGAGTEMLDVSGVSQRPTDEAGQCSISDVLAKERRVAVLGSPGTGKSTLIKRLCIAYIDESRRTTAVDELPDLNLFPVVIRCRQLNDLATRPVGEILDTLMSRAEMREQADHFRDYLGDQLRMGKALLLIDGLDEIATSSDRAQFVAQLRTFAGRYPNIRMVITSREVGFRSVAGAVDSICHKYRVSDLSDESIVLLVERWHREVLGNSSAVEKDATDLAEAIISTDRVRRLAVNPLLLTTLLLVRRWIGQLPRRRTVLYQKAIEVLLMTWNVEGHSPIDPDEALPQLAYAAYQMMVEGKSEVTSSDLSGLFSEARNSVPELLAYATMSVHDFLERVEERSSLLVRSGQRIETGELKWVYEFKHLTFQEYLCAIAIVQKHLPTELRNSAPDRILAKRLRDPRWREVVAISAVLAGRDSAKILDRLTMEATKLQKRLSEALSKRRSSRAITNGRVELMTVLGNIVACLTDEAPIAPTTVQKTANFLIESFSESHLVPSASAALINGVYGGRYYEIVRDLIRDGLESDRAYPNYVYALSQLADREVLDMDASYLSQCFRAGIVSADLFDRTRWTLILMTSAYNSRGVSGASNRRSISIDDQDMKWAAQLVATSLVETSEMWSPLRFSSIWALAWSGHLLADRVELVNRSQIKLLEIWRGEFGSHSSNFAAWALYALPIVGTWPALTAEEETGLRQFIDQRYADLDAERADDHRMSSILVAYYTKIFDEGWIAQAAFDCYRKYDKKEISFSCRMLSILGPVGQAFLKRIDEPDTDSPEFG